MAPTLTDSTDESPVVLLPLMVMDMISDSDNLHLHALYNILDQPGAKSRQA